MENTPRRLKESGKSIQRDIREIMANISRKRKHTLLRAKATGTITVPTEECESNASRMAVEIATPVPAQQPLSKPEQTKDNAKKANPYARELFFRHTNLIDVLAQMIPERSKTTHRKVAAELYEDYVSKPRQNGYRKYLQNIRFDTRFNEGMFRTVLKVPITSAQGHTVYKRKLAEAGVTKMCYVDMTQNNLVLEHKEKVEKYLKENFRDWAAKLGKLPKYITASQRMREHEDRKFLKRLRKHSSLKGSWALRIPDVVDELVREFRIPSEQRQNMIWPKLRFDTEDMNRQYSTGNYCRFQNDLELEPDDLMELPPRRTHTLVQGESRAENADSSAVQSNVITLPATPTSDSQSSNARQSHQAFAIPASTISLPNETWEGEIQISRFGKTTLRQHSRRNSIEQQNHNKNAPVVVEPNQPQRISGDNDPNLWAPCRTRARHIPYDLEGSSDPALNTDATSDANNPSIAYVSIVQQNLNTQITPLIHDSALPDTESFTPVITSTQDQSAANERQRVHIAEVPSSTQDPLQLTGAISTLCPVYARLSGSSPTTNLLAETISQNVHAQSQLQPSSTIPPFQTMNSPLNVLTRTIIENSPSIKQEHLSERQSKADLSGYDEYVEILSNSPEVIVIDSDSTLEFDPCMSAINEQIRQILARKEESMQMTTDQERDLYLSCAEGAAIKDNVQNVENETDQ